MSCQARWVTPVDMERGKQARVSHQVSWDALCHCLRKPGPGNKNCQAPQCTTNTRVLAPWLRTRHHIQCTPDLPTYNSYPSLPTNTCPILLSLVPRCHCGKKRCSAAHHLGPVQFDGGCPTWKQTRGNCKTGSDHLGGHSDPYHAAQLICSMYLWVMLGWSGRRSGLLNTSASSQRISQVRIYLFTASYAGGLDVVLCYLNL